MNIVMILEYSDVLQNDAIFLHKCRFKDFLWICSNTMFFTQIILVHHFSLLHISKTLVSKPLNPLWVYHHHHHLQHHHHTRENDKHLKIKPVSNLTNMFSENSNKKRQTLNILLQYRSIIGQCWSYICTVALGGTSSPSQNSVFFIF